VVAGIATAAIYKTYKWIKGKKVKPHKKKIITKQAPNKKSDFEDSERQAGVDWLFAAIAKR
jgi:hypothetical protein